MTLKSVPMFKICIKTSGALFRLGSATQAVPGQTCRTGKKPFLQEVSRPGDLQWLDLDTIKD